MGLLPGRRLSLPLPAGYHVRSDGDIFCLYYGNEEIVAGSNRAIRLDDVVQLIGDHMRERVLHAAALRLVVHRVGRVA